MPNKTDLVNHVALEASLNRIDAQKAVEAVFDGIIDMLRYSEEMNIRGFGSFVVKKRATRKGRNPRTGQSIQLAPSKRPAFIPGIDLKKAVSGQ